MLMKGECRSLKARECLVNYDWPEGRKALKSKSINALDGEKVGLAGIILI